jgi:hypothetical protein
MSAVFFLILRLLISGLLFCFLGWAFWTIWQDVKALSKKVSQPDMPKILLSAENNPLISGSFTLPEILIGRDPACNLRLNENSISGRHSKISYHHNQWWIEDLNSTNGSFLNGELVRIPLVLADNDQLRLGNINFLVKFEQ